MKILYSLFRHLTEVIFPALAFQFGWDTYNDKDIKLRICNALRVSVPVHPNRSVTSTLVLKKIVALCYEIKENPVLFMFLESSYLVSLHT